MRMDNDEKRKNMSGNFVKLRIDLRADRVDKKEINYSQKPKQEKGGS